MNWKWQLSSQAEARYANQILLTKLILHFQEDLKTVGEKNFPKESYQNNLTLLNQNKFNTKFLLNVMNNAPLKRTCEASGFLMEKTPML